jgi:hypothetical protein
MSIDASKKFHGREVQHTEIETIHQQPQKQNHHQKFEDNFDCGKHLELLSATVLFDCDALGSKFIRFIHASTLKSGKHVHLMHLSCALQSQSQPRGVNSDSYFPASVCAVCKSSGRFVRSCHSLLLSISNLPNPVEPP